MRFAQIGWANTLVTIQDRDIQYCSCSEKLTGAIVRAIIK